MKELLYLRNVTGIKAILQEVLPPTMGLPLYLTSTYELYTSTVLGVDCVFAIIKKDNFKFLEIKNHQKLIQQTFDAPAIFVFADISYSMIVQLIKHKVSFIHLDHQVFMPFILMNLKEDKKTNIDKLNMKKVNTSRTAEEIVISEILKQNISGKTGKEITKLMDESPMTISRALFELQQHNYCKLIQNGREKTVTLLDKNRLWVLVKNNFTTPVESTTFVKDLKNIEHYTVKAGTTALSKLGMLNEEDKAILAIYKKEYIKLLKNNKINLCNEDDARFIIEVWNISPFFCSNNGIINPISLYLSMKDEADDRIQLEIKKILEQYGLNIDG